MNLPTELCTSTEVYSEVAISGVRKRGRREREGEGGAREGGRGQRERGGGGVGGEGRERGEGGQRVRVWYVGSKGVQRREGYLLQALEERSNSLVIINNSQMMQRLLHKEMKKSVT